MSSENRLMAVIVIAILCGFGVKLGFNLELSPPSKPGKEETKLLRAEDEK
jgi:hypothetical protein